MDRPGRISRPRLDSTLRQWFPPPLPPELTLIVEKHQGDRETNWVNLANWVREKLSQTNDSEQKTKLELATLDWLFRFIRSNIKRGRVFELDQVLTQGSADCLGYAQVFRVLGKRFGLDIGIVEVVIDNAGRYVPHSVNLLKLANRRSQLVDLWYGAKDINHRRIGARVKEQGKWLIKDIDWSEIAKGEEVEGLPPRCVEAITYYIRGNRHLEQGIRDRNIEELDKAIEYYNAAIALYPTNARCYFNRAVAYENKGEKEKAAGDYTQALRDEASQIRVLAREYEESTRLIELDRMDLSLEQQEIYLLRKGFITGREEPAKEIAGHYAIPVEEVERIISQIEASIPHSM